MMARAKTSRKAQFRAALALVEMSAKDWADREGISAGHLSQVLDGNRDSLRLLQRIDAFTREHLSKHAALAS